VLDVPRHEAKCGAVSGRHRRHGRKPASCAAAAEPGFDGQSEEGSIILSHTAPLRLWSLELTANEREAQSFAQNRSSDVV
jgi:hypothetical protein